MRQSTITQKEQNKGSAKVQLGLIEYGQALGWPLDRIKLFDALGESGSRGDRKTFRALLREVKNGNAGAIAFAKGDRLGRTALESQELLDAAAANRTLIICENRIYNPASASDKLMLGMLSQFAEYENQARTNWMMVTRFALAKQGSYRVVLPTGLIAASPEDERFLSRLEEAGLSKWLENLDQHEAVSEYKGKKHYVLPYPDKEIYDACRMRMECMLTTRSFDAVVEMIMTDPDYPRPGMIPSTKAIRRYKPGIEVRWKNVAHPNGRTILRGWFESPALYGNYTFNSPGLAALNPDKAPGFYSVRIEGAFPSFAPPSEEDRVGRVLEKDKKPWRIGRFKGHRPHMLDILRCGTLLEDGSPCGNRLTAMYQPDGSYGYFSRYCKQSGHKQQHAYGNVVDPLVLEGLLQVFEPDALARAMADLRISTAGARDRLASLDKELQSLDFDISGANKAIFRAENEGSIDRKIALAKGLDDLLRRKRHLQESMDQARADVKDFMALAKQDKERIVALGADLPRLLMTARQCEPDLYRALVGELIESVLFERISGYACTVELVFPAGKRLRLTCMTRNLASPRVAIEYAAGRLNEGIDPTEIARELNRAPAINHRVPWDEDRVITAPVALQHQELPPLRKGTHWSLSELAAEAGDLSEKDLFVHAVQGRFGPGYYEDGETWIQPTQEELHRYIPTITARDVAQQGDWPSDDVITVVEAARIEGVTRSAISGRAQRRSGQVKDAVGRNWARRSEVIWGTSDPQLKAKAVSGDRRRRGTPS